MEALYYYTARNSTGAFVRGSLQSLGPDDALANLRARALCVTSLQPAASTGGALLATLSLRPVRRVALSAFFRCLATLLAAGVPIRRSLQLTLERAGDARLREALRATLREIESGAALSAAMAKRPNEFAKMFTAAIAAGESGGNLDEVLERLASMLERDLALRKRLATALAYPAFVLAAACALVVFLLSTIVPSFGSMYAQLHVPLPRQTVFLLALSSAAGRPQAWVAALAFATVGFAGVMRLRTSGPAREMLAAMRFGIPVLGPILRKALLARIASTLGSLLRSGVDLIAALDVTSQAAGSALYVRSLLRVRDAVIGGQPLAGTFDRDALYEPLFAAMIEVGEEAGALDELLLRAGDYYERDVEAALGTLTALAEPAMILLLGLLVGSIVAAIFVPLYSLIGSIK